MANVWKDMAHQHYGTFCWRRLKILLSEFKKVYYRCLQSEHADGKCQQISNVLKAIQASTMRWRKRACLARDGGKCVITGAYDPRAYFTKTGEFLKCMWHICNQKDHFGNRLPTISYTKRTLQKSKCSTTWWTHEKKKLMQILFNTWITQTL